MQGSYIVKGCSLSGLNKVVGEYRGHSESLPDCWLSKTENIALLSLIICSNLLND